MYYTRFVLAFKSSLVFLTCLYCLGLIFVYFTLASVLWWLAIAFNLFLIAVIKVPMRQLNWRLWLREWKTGQAFWKLETLCVAYHLFCWVPPIIPLIISVSAEKLGYGQDLWYVTTSITNRFSFILLIFLLPSY